MAPDINYPLPVHKDLTNQEYAGWKDFLRQAEGWSAERIRAHQLAEIKRIIGLGWNNASGYASLWQRHGIEPGDIRTLEDVRRLPMVNKRDLAQNIADYTVQNKEAEYITTGGSSGVPLGFWRTPRAFARELASKAHQYERIGWHEGMRQLVLRGVPVPENDHIQYVPEFHELRCSTYFMTDEYMQRYYEAALDFQPEVIRCYPSAGTLFASYLQRTRQKIPGVKMVLCASENLYMQQKRLLEEIFSARIFSHYGHYELSVLAGYCEYEDNIILFSQLAPQASLQ